VLANRPEGTFANLLLPSIPTTNLRSTKQIVKGSQFYNVGAGVDKGLVGKDLRDHDIPVRRNDTSFKVVRNVNNASGLSESPILSQNKLPDRQFNNGLGSGGGQQRPDSFRIRHNNPNFVKSVQ